MSSRFTSKVLTNERNKKLSLQKTSYFISLSLIYPVGISRIALFFQIQLNIISIIIQKGDNKIKYSFINMNVLQIFSYSFLYCIFAQELNFSEQTNKKYAKLIRTCNSDAFVTNQKISTFCK